MEEGDGSISGSSPLSEGSQSDLARRLLPKQGKWKLFGVASPESTSRGSSKTGQESPELGETGKSAKRPFLISRLSYLIRNTEFFSWRGMGNYGAAAGELKELLAGFLRMEKPAGSP